MKKIILLFSVALSVCVTSCQTDEDNAGPADNTQDKFVGSWKITQEFEGIEELTLSECDLKQVLTVTSDQKLIWKIYDVVEGGTCQLEDDLEVTWKNIGDTMYELIPELEVGDPQEVKITFSGDTMTLEVNDDGDISRRVYNRI